ncbi:MAG: archaellin/type IV pilin N-terminal domain-containing protein [Desulfurococcaceae archaeon]
MSRRYKGIEPIIAVVILVAVTLVIAIGVIGWIMGWWGTFGATESIRVYPDSYITGNTLYLHIKNEGSAAAVIYKIEVSGLGTADITGTNGTLGEPSGGEVKVDPGAEGWITCSLGTATAVAGTRYQVTIYTRAGNVISATVQAK